MNPFQAVIDCSSGSGHYFSIYCNQTDTCYIKCKLINSCVNLRLYCFGTCFVFCKPENGIACPQVIVGNYTEWNTLSPTTLPTFLPTIAPSASGMPSHSNSDIDPVNPTEPDLTSIDKLINSFQMFATYTILGFIIISFLL